jgi:hypothetical protein
VVESTAEPLGLERPRSPGCAGWHTYVRRQPEGTVLHQVVREHLETFLAEARLRGGGGGLPRFVERELHGIVLVFVVVFAKMTSTSTNTIHDRAGACASSRRTWWTACSATYPCASGY